jgi:hypothetical protein
VFTRILIATALGAGGLLGAVAVVVVPGSVWGAAVCGAFAGVLVSLRGRNTASGDAGGTRDARRAGLLAGAGTAGALLALIGLVVLAGAAAGTFLLVALLVVGLVWTRRRTRWSAAAPRDPQVADHRGAAPGGDPSPRGAAGRPSRVAAPAAPSSDPADLTAPQLCAVWQRTYFALLDLPVGASREAVTHLRGRLLDEMERRDPAGFARWLEAGPRAASNPGRFLSDG